VRASAAIPEAAQKRPSAPTWGSAASRAASRLFRAARGPLVLVQRRAVARQRSLPRPAAGERGLPVRGLPPLAGGDRERAGPGRPLGPQRAGCVVCPGSLVRNTAG